MAKMNKIKFLSQVRAPNLRNLTTNDDYWGIVKALNSIHSSNFLAINQGTKEIAESEYANKTAYKIIAIPDGVTTIGANAFQNCSGLVSMHMPESITTIGDYAFSGCSGLTRFYIPGDIQSIGANAFSGLAISFYTSLPKSKLSGYPWGANKDYSSIHYTCCDGTECTDNGCVVNNETHTHTEVTTVTQAATCTLSGTQVVSCSECGATLREEPIDALGHKYGTLIPATEAKHTSTTLSPSIAAHYQCSSCDRYFTEDKKATTLTLLTGTTPTHTYGDWVTSDTNHWKVCTYAGCGSVSSDGAHVDSNSDNYCDTCYYEITATHTCTIKTIGEKSGQAATCDTDGWKSYFKCEICGELYEDSAGTRHIASLDLWKKNNGKIPAGHTGGTATCTEPAECSVCNKPYGNPAGHKLTQVDEVKAIHNENELQAGVAAHYKCSVCNKLFKDSEAKDETTSEELTEQPYHSYSNWQSVDDKTHTGTCSCNKTKTENHIDNNTDGKCDVCGENMSSGGDTPVDPPQVCTHEDCTYTYDADGYHFKQCNDCKEIIHELCSTENTHDHENLTHTSTCKYCQNTSTIDNALTVSSWLNTGHVYTCSCGYCSDPIAHDFKHEPKDAHYHYNICKICEFNDNNPSKHTPGAAATCTTPQTCTECDYVIAETIDHVPTYSNNNNGTHDIICSKCEKVLEDNSTCVVSEAATCESPAKCACGYVLDAPLPHSWGDWLGTDASCTESGTKTRTCENCPKTETKTFAATGHTKVDGNGKTPTCTEPGLTAGKYCSTCGETIEAQKEIAADGHKPETVAGYAATCTSTGKSDGEICSVCKATLKYQSTIPATNHEGTTTEYEEVPATCTDAGMTSGTYCNSCKTWLDKRTVIQARGHSFGYYSYNNNATCTKDGTETATCENCSATDTRSATGTASHVYNSVVVTPATCTTGGYTTYTCIRCGDSYKDNETDPNGHLYGEWVTDKQATCTGAGTKHKTCEKCNDVLTGTISALGHVPIEDNGVSSGIACERCGEEL